ncbi:MAG: HPr family phosphocarrier protein [Cellvibrionaceae bacterium]
MQEKQLTIINQLGLHARAAAKLAQTCARFGSSVRIVCKGKEVDGKSVMSLMLLAASKGTDITVITDGDDEDTAMETISDLINDYFGEGG